jgi:hypothetical protein
MLWDGITAQYSKVWGDEESGEATDPPLPATSRVVDEPISSFAQTCCDKGLAT